MKIIKYIVGIVAFIIFFLLIDPTGIGFKKHKDKIKSWASGEAKHLNFERSHK